MKSTKALSIGQVFIYILVALTFAVIMIFGYKSISEFIQRGDQVQFYQFKTDLESSIQRIYTEYGSVRESTFHVPARFSRICFVDVNQNSDNIIPDSIALNAWETSKADANKQENRGKKSYDLAAENVFLTPQAPDKIKVHDISIAGGKGFRCLDIKNGAFTLTMEGKGDKTELS